MVNSFRQKTRSRFFSALGLDSDLSLDYVTIAQLDDPIVQTWVTVKGIIQKREQHPGWKILRGGVNSGDASNSRFSKTLPPLFFPYTANNGCKLGAYIFPAFTIPSNRRQHRLQQSPKQRLPPTFLDFALKKNKENGTCVGTKLKNRGLIIIEY